MSNDFDIYKNFLFIIFSMIVFLKIFSKNIRDLEIFLIIIFSFSYIFLFGLRDLNIGSDTNAYIKNYIKINNSSLSFEQVSDTIFFILSKLNNFLGFKPNTILLIIALIFMINIAYFCIKYSKKNALILLYIFTSFFFFYNLGINILRQGLAISFFLVGVSLNNRYNRILYFILTILSHISSIILLGVYYLSKYVKINIAIGIFFSSIILSYLQFDFRFIVSLLPFFERFIKYTNEDGHLASMYETGFKTKFVLFNIFFLIIGLLIKKYLIEDIRYNNLLSTFCLMSSIFFLCFNIPFSDRIGIYSWCLLPLLILPIFTVKYKNMISFKVSMFIVLTICYFLID